ncbi:flagellar hook protein FlgE [Sphingomonas immobilis]|uniref:Flagellar hook protein FlgE n=1 Tax=Sphingomonas immobilis TaxID=3063997 RepID=A0ABT8ZWU7_9SPHN|nr:flagellar hook protein FlgE [Sphingomonas sp. CA1-15]MDO7841505.1 flagellar hook protein FlgE [Sphingomonas sp. CA1-15]
MSFYTSLSGLQVAQADMNVTSHNLANVGTNGFKKSRSDFADVIASNFTTDPRRQVGMGATLKQNVQQFGEGNLKTTTSGLDLAISGDGFFAVRTNGLNGTLAYTRNGGFTVDSNRDIVDAQGSALLGYPVDANGTPTATDMGSLTKLTIPEISGTPKPTANVALDVNLQSGATTPANAFAPSDPSSYNGSAATTVYDAAGNAMTMTTYFVRDSANDTATSTAWNAYSYVNGQQMTTGGVAATPVSFDTTGTMLTPTAAVAYDSFTPASSGVAQSFSLNLAGSAQTAGGFSVNTRSQDGAAVGQFSGISVDSTGLVTASYSNGDNKLLGKVALANFTTPTGLRQVGNSYWQQTGVSGSPQLGQAGDSGYGGLMSSTIEGSNVDITEELVNLISAQRNFQANSKALDIQSSLIQTIFQIQS